MQIVLLSFLKVHPQKYNFSYHIAISEALVSFDKS